MKRAPLKRYTPLRSRSRLRPVALKPKRRKRSHVIHDKKYLAFVREHGCIVEGLHGHVCWGRVEAHHEDHFGRGRDNDYNAVPLCWKAHRDFAGSRHKAGRAAFESHYGVSFDAAITGLLDEWDLRNYKEVA